ncbi:MAG: hypothetical protein QOF02_2194 [Blastocatellia bacterium]|jgi:hypothetical protein|nr:hypothetical protein [Blastocatellia bacterium]
MWELGWELPGVFGLLIFLLALARYQRYCCGRDGDGLDDSDEE